MPLVKKSPNDDADGFTIRAARDDESHALTEIENEAGAMFDGLGLIDEARDRSFPGKRMADLVARSQVWVGCKIESGPPVGMIAVSVLESTAYIEEMDVLPAFGCRGLGTRLLHHACDWAKQRRCERIVLSTFSSVSWNGPFYRKNGFQDLARDEWTDWMRAIREDEGRRGLCVEERVFMELRLR